MVKYKGMKTTIEETNDVEETIQNSKSTTILSNQEVKQRNLKLKITIEELRDTKKRYEIQSTHRKRIFNRSVHNRYGLSTDKNSIIRIDGVSKRKGSYYDFLQDIRQVKLQNIKDLKQGKYLH